MNDHSKKKDIKKILDLIKTIKNLNLVNKISECNRKLNSLEINSDKIEDIRQKLNKINSKFNKLYELLFTTTIKDIEKIDFNEYILELTIFYYKNDDIDIVDKIRGILENIQSIIIYKPNSMKQIYNVIFVNCCEIMKTINNKNINTSIIIEKISSCKYFSYLNIKLRITLDVYLMILKINNDPKLLIEIIDFSNQIKEIKKEVNAILNNLNSIINKEMIKV